MRGVRRRLRPRRRRRDLRRRARGVRAAGPPGLPRSQVAHHGGPWGEPCPLWDAGDDPSVRRGATRALGRPVAASRPSRHVLRRTSRRAVGVVGRSPPAPRCRLGRDRVREPAPRVPMGGAARPDHGRGDRRDTTFLAYTVQRFEPIDWAEEILAAPGAAELALLPRVYTAASVCQYTGRVDAALDYASAAIALEGDARYDAFQPEWTRIWQANAHRIAGHDDEFNAALSSLLPRAGLGRVWALTMSLYTSPAPPADRATEPTATAEETMIVVRAHGNPYYIALAGVGFSRALSTTDADRARDAGHEALTLAEVDRIAVMERVIIREIAALDVVHGRLDPRWSRSTGRSTRCTERATSPVSPRGRASRRPLRSPRRSGRRRDHLRARRWAAAQGNGRRPPGSRGSRPGGARGDPLPATCRRRNGDGRRGPATRYVRAEIARARAEPAPHP